MLSAEIIAIGSELLTPERTDTNSLWLTERLNRIGIEVMLKTIVGDDRARLEETVRDAVRRSDLVIMTGGLGPTEDDITRECVAKALGRELTYREELAEDLRIRFSKMGREMPEINKRQAFVIDGADVLPNPNGSAVGLLVPGVSGSDQNQAIVVLLPGPPRENQPMFTDHVFPRLGQDAGDIVFRKRVLKVSGLGESAIDEMIAPIYSAATDVRTSILFNKSEVEVHLTAQARTVSDADELLSGLVGQITEKLGVAVFSVDGEEMETVVGKMLKTNGKTIAVAESCTGGLISQRLTDVPGSSAYFIEAAVTYANEAKIARLGVPETTIHEFGAVSAQTAEAMAKGMKTSAKTDFAISVTGIAGPDGGSEDKPVGTVFIGYADESETKSFKIVLPGDRYLVRWRASQAALDYLRRQMIKKGLQT